jgi:EAL domain-containing protein (putative c-di-GMP-specific phosphodiesterase class I)
VRCFAEMARIIGVKTVAEFVDRQEVLDKLRAIGIDYAQGFLLQRHAPFEEVLAGAAPQPA